MKKFLLTVFSLFLIMGVALPTSAESFTDVEQYKEEIELLSSKGIIKGYPDGTFKPDNPIKRIQAVQMILREKGITNLDAPNPNLTDMKPGTYGYEEVAKAVSLGFIDGKTDPKTGEKYFDPNGTLTRGQMAKILSLAYALKGTSPLQFTDVPKGHWAYSFVSTLAANDITTGYPDGTFKPNNKLTRQHFAVFMARMLMDDGQDPAKELSAHFIDVGQGDSSLIVTPNGKNVLIDGGKKSAGEKVVSYLKAAGVSSIDLLVATHPDADHIGGLIDVLETFPVKSVLDSGKDHTSQTYIDYLSLIDEKDIPFNIAKTGESISVDPSVKIQVLNSSDNGASDNNEASVVLKITYNQIDFLYTGDAGVEAEEKMIGKFNLDAEIFKVSHHGSDTGTSDEFLKEVTPTASILSYGENSYGHPTSEVVSKLRESGSSLYSTMDQGDIVVTTDGKAFNVSADPWEATVIPEPEPGTENGNVKITNVDLDKEIVTIKNEDTKDITMTGWKLVSVEGNQSFDFPEGFVLKAGATVYVTSGQSAKDQAPTYLKWTGAYIWNNSGDAAELYNAAGDKVSEIK